MNWIKVRHDLREDPDTVEMAGRLGMDEFGVVGRLHAVWSWLDKHSDDGLNVRTTSAFLDRLAACPGFADALRAVGWLDGRDGDLTFPGYTDHNGGTAKRRAQEAIRQARQRDKSHAKTVTESVTRPLPEKRRVEKRDTTPLPPPGARAVGACPIPDSLKDEGFPEAWADWVAYRDELGESLTSYTSRQVLLKCERWGPKRAVVLIRRAIGNSWKNIRDDHELNHGPGGKPPGPPAKPRPPDKSPAWMHDARKVRDFLNGDQSLTDEQARALVLGFPSDFSVVWFADAQHRNWVKSVLREKA